MKFSLCLATLALASTAVSELLVKDNGLSMNQYSYPMAAISTFNPATSGPAGPSSNRYGDRERYFQISIDGKEGVLWQDPANLKITISVANGNDMDVLELLSPADQWLYAAAANDQNEIIYMTVGTTANDDKVTGLPVKLIKVNSKTGDVIKDMTLDTSSSALNFWKAFASGASMTWDAEKKEIALVITRLFSKSSDNLNHQGGTALVYDSDTFEQKNKIFASSHCWGARVQSTSDGKYVATELGDNNPRGISLRVFDANSNKQKLIYTFKTNHGSDPTNSNDNRVYTELSSSIIEYDDSYLVFFVGERPSLDNSQAQKTLNAPRNIACVRVNKFLNETLTPGGIETGSFYNYWSTEVKQKNEGIVWVTNFPTLEDNVSRLKARKLADDTNLLIFEVWNNDGKSYNRTSMMIVDKDGSVVRTPVTTNATVRLPFSDRLEMKTVENEEVAVLYSGDESGNLIKNEFTVGAGIANGNNGNNAATIALSTAFTLLFSGISYLL